MMTGEVVVLPRDKYEHMIQMLTHAFTQACFEPRSGSFQYDHQCISTWEEIQTFLIQENIIQPEQCRRQ